MSDAEGKLERWRHRLQEVDVDVVYLPGIVNRSANALSRLGSDAAEPTELDEDIPTLLVIAPNRDSEEQSGTMTHSVAAPTPDEQASQVTDPTNEWDSSEEAIDGDEDLLTSESDIVEVSEPPFPVAVSPSEFLLHNRIMLTAGPSSTSPINRCRRSSLMPTVFSVACQKSTGLARRWSLLNCDGRFSTWATTNR